MECKSIVLAKQSLLLLFYLAHPLQQEFTVFFYLCAKIEVSFRIESLNIIYHTGKKIPKNERAFLYTCTCTSKD